MKRAKNDASTLVNNSAPCGTGTDAIAWRGLVNGRHGRSADQPQRAEPSGRCTHGGRGSVQRT